jgi:hypothetical protein
MLVACRLAGLSALEAYYAGVRACAQCGADASKGPAGGQARIHRAANLPEACPQPPERLGGESERATSDNLYPRKRRAPRLPKLDVDRGDADTRASK